jgi:hypothetical protein
MASRNRPVWKTKITGVARTRSQSISQRRARGLAGDGGVAVVILSVEVLA